MAGMHAAQRFRQYIAGGEPLFAPGVHDCVTARIAEQVGYKVIYMGGFATSGAIYGKPDVGLLTLTEMIAHARNIVGSVSIPVFADADTGHGNPINVRRTIQEYEKAGVAGVHIEDQTHPKKCGNLPDRHVIAAREMVEKVKAAVDARVNDDFVVAVRSDSYLDCGLNELIDRGHAYAEAGADVFWPLLYNCKSREEMIRVGKSFDIPLMASLVNYSETAFIDIQEWAEMGFRVVISPFGALQIAAPVIQAFLREVKETGSLKGSANRLMAFDTVTDILGLADIKVLERKHGIG